MQNPTKFTIVVTSLFNLVISSFPNVMFYHVYEQRCSSLFVHQAMNSLFQHAWTSLSTTLFKLASSTMFKPVNNTVRSSWPAQPCSILSTGKNKQCVFMCVYVHVGLNEGLSIMNNNDLLWN